jgi:hypothetical protein
VITYRVSKQYEGVYHVLDDEGERVARVARFMPGPMVSFDGPRITPPNLAKAIARAMQRLASDIERATT